MSNLHWLDPMPDAPEFGYVNLDKRQLAGRNAPGAWPITEEKQNVEDLNTEDGVLDFNSSPELDKMRDVTDADNYKHALERIYECLRQIDYMDLSTAEVFVFEQAQEALGK